MAWENGSAVIILGLTFLFVYLAVTLEDKFWYLKLLFLGFGFFIALNGADFMRLMLIENSITGALVRRAETQYKIMMWALRVIFIFLFIVVIINTIKYFRSIKLSRKLKRVGGKL